MEALKRLEERLFKILSNTQMLLSKNSALVNENEMLKKQVIELEKKVEEVSSGALTHEQEKQSVQQAVDVLIKDIELLLDDCQQ